MEPKVTCPITLDVLPDDVLYDVLYHSSVRDILSLRQVSRKFYHLTHHRAIWSDAYTRCPILLPPGPFSYQSAADLELTLKKSHLLEANWTSPSPCPVSIRTFVDTSVDRWSPGNNYMKLVGRYLLSAGHPMLRCYDIESENQELTPIAVYDCIATTFDCVLVENSSSVDNSDCQFRCALMTQDFGTVTLLTLRISRGSAKFELKNEVRVLIKPCYNEVKITGDFLALGIWAGAHSLLHIPTCQVYDLPPLEARAASTGLRDKYALTSNHIIRFSYPGSETSLEVFPLPRVTSQPTDDATTPQKRRNDSSLTRSHGYLHDHRIVQAILLTERYELHDNNNQSAHYTFIALSRPARKPDQLGFLDISLVSDLATITWTLATEFEGEGCLSKEIRTITGSSRSSASRLLGRTAFYSDPIAITVSEDGDGKRAVRCRRIAVMDEQQPVAFDGIHGRMCRLVSPAQIEVISFV